MLRIVKAHTKGIQQGGREGEGMRLPQLIYPGQIFMDNMGNWLSYRNFTPTNVGQKTHCLASVWLDFGGRKGRGEAMANRSFVFINYVPVGPPFPLPLPQKM